MNVNENKLRIYFVVAMLLASQGAALAGSAPSGIRVTEPEALAGFPGPLRPPGTFEQLDVFGKSSTSFSRGIVDPRWSPGSDWNNSTDLNNFALSRWYQSPIDPSWEPEPAIIEDDDVTNFNPSRWQAGTVDRNWYPKDG